MDYVLIIASYIIGSIPFGFLLTKFSGKGDIRKLGSGNIGATNVLRTGNKFLAFCTLLLDGLKGTLVVILAEKYFSHNLDILYIASLAVVLGHMFPFWLKFKGGKGVATAIAVILSLNINVGILFCIVWLATFLASRIASLSSMIACFALPIFSIIVFVNWKLSILCALLAILIIAKHYENILRLLRGEEKKLKFKSE